MTKTTLKALALWLFDASDLFHNFDTPENWWGEEEWAEYNQDWDTSFYLSEVISREVMSLAK